MTLLSTGCSFETAGRLLPMLLQEDTCPLEKGALAETHSPILVHFLATIHLTTWEHISTPEIPAEKKRGRHCRSLDKRGRDYLGSKY